MDQYQVITGKLIARTAVHIGTGDDRKVADTICRRNASGDPIVPGTALAGALRSMATRLAPRLGSNPCQTLLATNQRNAESSEACGCWTCRLFGDINPQESSHEQVGGRASRLIVSHAVAVLPKDKPPRIRDGVGIDRKTKTAARAGSIKFSLEVLPAQTEFALRIELAEKLDEHCELLLAAVLAEWTAGRVWLGGRVARGARRVQSQKLAAARTGLQPCRPIAAIPGVRPAVDHCLPCSRLAQ